MLREKVMAATAGVNYYRPAEVAAIAKPRPPAEGTNRFTPTATASPTRTVVVCEGTHEMLQHLVMKLEDILDRRLDVRAMAAYGVAQVPALAGFLSAAGGAGNRIIMLIDGDGVPAGEVRQAWRDRVPAEAELVIAEPELEAWLVPTDSQADRSSRNEVLRRVLNVISGLDEQGLQELQTQNAESKRLVDLLLVTSD